MPPTLLSVLSTPEKRILHFHFLWVSCLRRFFALPHFSCWVQSHINPKTIYLHFHIYGNPTISYQHKNIFFALLLLNLWQSHKNISTQKEFFALSHLLQSHKLMSTPKEFFALSLSHLWQSHIRRLWWLATWSTAANRENWTKLGPGTNHGSSNMSKDSLRQVHMWRDIGAHAVV